MSSQTQDSIADKDALGREGQHIQKKPRSDSRLEPCLFQRKPVDDTLWNLSVFLSKSINHCLAKNIQNAQIEIEGRLGKIIDKKSRKRVCDATASESVFGFDSNHNFDPNMSMEQHGLFNQMLNYAATKNPNVKCSHTKCIDSIYDSIRVTKNLDKETCIQKIKVSDLHIRSPNCEFDFRISVNLEVPVEIPKDLGKRVARSVRKKDRLSYNHQVLCVDLTQVINEDEEKIHELEVEFTKTSALIEQKKLADSHSPNSFCNMVEVLLNTLRMLNRMGKAAPF